MFLFQKRHWMANLYPHLSIPLPSLESCIIFLTSCLFQRTDFKVSAIIFQVKVNLYLCLSLLLLLVPFPSLLFEMRGPELHRWGETMDFCHGVAMFTLLSPIIHISDHHWALKQSFHQVIYHTGIFFLNGTGQLQIFWDCGKLKGNCQWTRLKHPVLQNMGVIYYLPSALSFSSYCLHWAIHLNYWHSPVGPIPNYPNQFLG